MNMNSDASASNPDAPSTDASNAPDEIELEVFRAGDYGARGDWPAERLDAIAADYDPDLHEAPVTLDHAQTGPALGWVAGVRRSGDRLVARVRAAGRELIDALRRGTFKKRSVELYPALPETGRPYLKAVSLLGAAAPAVRGLRDPRFSEEGAPDEAGARGEGEARGAPDAGGEWTEWTGWTGWTEGGSPEAPEVPEAPKAPDSSAERTATAAVTTTAIAPVHTVHEVHSVHPVHSPATRTRSFADIERELRATGRWRPVWGEMGAREFHAFLESLESSDALRFAEGIPRLGGRTPARWFADFLHALPPLLPMGESAPARRVSALFTGGAAGADPNADTPHVPFGEAPSIPFGEAFAPSPVPTNAPNVDARSLDRHRRASALMRERPGLDYATALLRADRAT